MAGTQGPNEGRTTASEKKPVSVGSFIDPGRFWVSPLLRDSKDDHVSAVRAMEDSLSNACKSSNPDDGSWEVEELVACLTNGNRWRRAEIYDLELDDPRQALVNVFLIDSGYVLENLGTEKIRPLPEIYKHMAPLAYEFSLGILPARKDLDPAAGGDHRIKTVVAKEWASVAVMLIQDILNASTAFQIKIHGRSESGLLMGSLYAEIPEKPKFRLPRSTDFVRPGKTVNIRKLLLKHGFAVRDDAPIPQKALLPKYTLLTSELTVDKRATDEVQAGSSKHDYLRSAINRLQM